MADRNDQYFLPFSYLREIVLRRKRLEELITNAIKGQPFTISFPLAPELTMTNTIFLYQLTLVAQLQLDYVTIQKELKTGRKLSSQEVAEMKDANEPAKVALR